MASYNSELKDIGCVVYWDKAVTLTCSVKYLIHSLGKKCQFLRDKLFDFFFCPFRAVFNGMLKSNFTIALVFHFYAL